MLSSRGPKIRDLDLFGDTFCLSYLQRITGATTGISRSVFAVVVLQGGSRKYQVVAYAFPKS